MNAQENRVGLSARRLGAAGIVVMLLTLVAITLPALLPGGASASLALPANPAASTTATPSGEPEWDILQYVLDHLPQGWTCGPIGGTPGHRTLGCTTGAGHSGSGSVDNYGDPESAQANWLQRRQQAQATYPTFYDTFWNGYPGYHGEGELPPYNFFYQEDFYWADVRVLGGTRFDDTNFHYSPDVPTAVMNAAQALGYLPPPSPTPTQPTGTPTGTPTVTPSASATPTCCTDLTAGANALCLWENNVWVGGGVTNNCTQNILGDYQLSLEVSANYSGTWTTLAWWPGSNVTFQVGQNSYGGYYTGGFPHQYNWYRSHMVASSADGCWQAEATTTPAPICFEATPVVTPTFTPTPTPSLTVPDITPSITATSTSTNTNTPSPTPTVEPEYAIIQYVLDHLPQGWTCYPIGGTPGHRTLGCITGAGHGGSGTVDNYGDPSVAQATWQQKYDHAQSYYPTFEERNWNGYPGYHGEGELPPYNFFYTESYYWAGVRVLGGTTMDDTNFHYAPDVGTAVMNAAQALGYLPPPSPTPTPATPVPTRTSTVTRTGTPTNVTTATVTPTGTPCVNGFRDVPPGSTFYDFVMCLSGRGIVGGYPDCTFRPNNTATRGQIAKIVSNAAGFVDDPGGQIFQDVPAGSTFYTWVNRVAIHSVVSGYPCGGPGEPCNPPGNLPYFRPAGSVTRGQISKIVSNAAGFHDPPGAQIFEDVPPGSTFYDFIYRLASRSVMNGYPCGGPGEPCNPPDNLPYFRPNRNATRGQIAKIVSNSFFPNCSASARH